MTSHSTPTHAVISVANTSLNPLRAFVDIKFSKLGIPFAFGVATYQNDTLYWSYGARETSFVDTYLLDDDAWLRALAPMDDVMPSREKLANTLHSYLRNVERQDFKLSVKRGVDHADADKLNVYANRITLVYLQTLMPNEMSDFRFMTVDGVDNNLQKRLAHTHELPCYPQNPVTYARTLALGLLEQAKST